MAMNPPLSPSSSPRLPSPPPMAEDQTGTQSPSISSSEINIRPLVAPATVQAQASRRIRPGTKAADMADGPPLVEFTEIDSAFQLTEHLKALHFSHTHPTHLPAVTLPVTAPVALLLATPPPGTDRALWLYELCRFLVQKVNVIVTSLFADQPPCSANTCPEMRASEWQYLCAVHDPPKACCAIDYCCHTLDWAANVLTNPKHFPSRLALGTEAAAPQHQVRQLTNIFRRVYRIFAHAWFSHRDMFWRVEGKTGLYILFKTVCDLYNLLPDDGYTIPAEAESREENTGPRERASHDVQDPAATIQAQPAPPPPSILKRSPPPPPSENTANTPTASQPPDPTPLNTVLATGATARRHRQTPSTSASPVETVMEENEEEDNQTDRGQPESADDVDASQAAHSPQPAQQQPHPFSPFSPDTATEQPQPQSQPPASASATVPEPASAPTPAPETPAPTSTTRSASIANWNTYARAGNLPEHDTPPTTGAASTPPLDAPVGEERPERSGEGGAFPAVESTAGEGTARGEVAAEKAPEEVATAPEAGGR